MAKVAINGFGRIGRMSFRAMLAHPELEIVAINDLTSADTLAYLFKYDSVHENFDGEVHAEGDCLVVNGKKVKIYAERDPQNLPWKDLGVDIVVESTGLFKKRDQMMKHINAGAKKVILTVPAGKADDVDATVVMGVNDNVLTKEMQLVSNASCTTNCLAPVAKVLNDKFGIKRGLMNTVHSYTNDQKILDQPHSDLRRARAAAVSIIPTDLTAELNCNVTKEDINNAVKEAANGPMKGVLQYVDEPIVSIDIIDNTHSSIFDSLLTQVMDGNFVKIVSWYDNEKGYSTRVGDLAAKLAKLL